MKKTLLLLILVLGLNYLGIGQSLLVDDFSGLVVGSPLAGQSSWTKFGSGPDPIIGNTATLTAANYNGGGGEYVIMPAPSGTTSKVSKALSSTPVPGTNTFYYSVLLRMSSTSATSTNYFLTLGDPTSGTVYFARMFAQSNGAGFSLGISKFSNTPTYGTTVLNYNQTYVVVVRYDFVTGSANDAVYLYVDPSLTSEPATGTAEASNTSSSDPSPATIGNFHWHNRGLANPVGSFDGVRVAYGATSTAAWTNLNAFLGGTTPLISVVPTTLNGFNYIIGAGPSAEQSFSISGSNLTANISIFPSANYEVSTGTGASFVPSSQIDLPFGSGTVSPTTINVRLKSGLAVNSYNGEVILAQSAGAANATVTCNGSVTAVLVPSITVTPGSLTGFTALFGTVSASNNYTVSGANLTEGVTVTAPSAYEVSTDNINFSSSIVLPQSGGSITGQPVTIHTRINASAPIGTAAGDITHASTGATTVNVNVTGMVIYPEPTNHAAIFSAATLSYASITNTWSDNDGTQAATGFLILANSTGIFTDPVDGIQAASDANLSDGTGLVYVNHAIQTYTWNNLPVTTHFYFAIYPYTNTGAYINYKTTPAAPVTNIVTMTCNTLAGWTFDATLSSPNTPTSVAANLGDQLSGMLYTDGSNGSSAWAQATELTSNTGTTLNDPRLTSAVAGKDYALLGGTANIANGKAMVLKFSMSALQDAELSFAIRGSSSGFNLHQWAWSTDGVNFTDFGTNTADNTANYISRTVELSSITQLNGAPEVYLRNTFNGATSSLGSNRFDNIVIRAVPATTLAPTVFTTAATNVQATTATVNGTVNANNQSTDVVFEYGPTAAYGSTAPGVPATVTGGTTTNVSADLAGLTQNNIVYHYRVKATNGSGITYGNDLTFNTGCFFPDDAGEITGPATVCANLQEYQYSVLPITNAATYAWSLPPGATIVAGELTNVITVTFAPGNDPGLIHVFGINDCGNEGNESQLAIAVNQPVDVSVSILASANPVASGTSVTFTATPANGGSTPQYQWSVNGLSVSGATNPAYTYVPQNNDVVTCVLTSSETCSSGSPATSNAITMSVTGTPANTTVTGTVVASESICYEATQTITVAGNSTTFEVLANGSATMKAGVNILYLPGTKVYSGGYMLGRIIPGGPYCSGAAPSAPSTGKEETGFSMLDNAIRIYPNPTSGVFTIEQLGESVADHATIEVYGTLGGRILSTALQGQRKQELSIAGNPPGIYFVKVMTGNNIQTVKIILTK